MKVFLSHIHEESIVAKVLKDWIESTFSGQIEVFVSSDIKDVPAGSRWLSEIDSALTSSSLFVMLCSPTSISRSWINFEAGCAWTKKVPLMPVCHSGMLKNLLPSPISTFQAIEIESRRFVDDFFESLKIHFKIPKLPRISKEEMVKELRKALETIDGSVQPLRVAKPKPVTPISDEDALNIIESWIGNRAATENVKAMKFSDVDSALNLPTGTARRLLETAAKRYNYLVRRKGVDTILFEEDPDPPIRNRPYELDF